MSKRQLNTETSIDKDFLTLYSKQITALRNPDFDQDILINANVRSTLLRLTSLNKKTIIIEKKVINVIKNVINNYAASLINIDLITLEDINTIISIPKDCFKEPMTTTTLLMNIIMASAKNQSVNNSHYENIFLSIATKIDLHFYIDTESKWGLIRHAVDNKRLKIADYFSKYIAEPSPETKLSIFLQALKVSEDDGNYNYLEKVIDHFKFNLDSITLGPSEPLILLIMDQPIHLRSKYLQLIYKKHEQHPDVDIYIGGYSLLALVCRTGDYMTAQLLVEYGADINLVMDNIIEGRSHKSTVFFEATKSKSLQLLQFLLSKGADICLAQKIHLQNYKELADTDYILPIFTQSYSSCDAVLFLHKVKYMIETHYLNMLLQIIEREEEASATTSVKVNSQDSLNHYIAIIKNNLLHSEQAKIDKIVLEKNCDLLILNFIRSKLDKDLEAIRNYISDHPELKLYPVASALKLTDEV
jgi:hypothetical protein